MNLGQGICMNNSENNLHHLHTTTASKTYISAYCCMCKFTVNVEIKEPFIDMMLFNDLSKIRKHTNTYANAVRRSGFEFEYKTSLAEVVNDMIQIVGNILDEDLQALKFNCENFEMDEVRLVHLFILCDQYRIINCMAF
jgi:hypothetical protein